MRVIISFFNKVFEVCRLVPLLPIVILAAIPVALLWDWRPWGTPFWSVDPSVGQWIVLLLVAYTVIDTLRGMIDDIRHGHVGVDVLAIVAILSTTAVREYWASWAIVLMIYSGAAIEEYAQAKAEGNLTALMQGAPVTAHVVRLPGVETGSGETGADQRERQWWETAASGGAAGGASDGVSGGDGEWKHTRAAAASPSDIAAAAANSPFDTIPVEEVRLGDILTVLPGETVPVDGELLSGSATLDLSNINGEPVPREVFAGARVMSGAVNGSSALVMRATQLARDSQYQRILELVASARDSRATVVRTADLLAVPFTVISFVIAGLAWAITGIPTRFAQVLVIATPCPLLIAAPVAYIAGTGRLAKAGILIKAQEVLENLGRVSHVFFDKTGTLTVKKPQVVRVDAAPGVETDADHILMFAGVLETYSVHILAQGIASAGTAALARLKGDEYPVITDVREESGSGVSGVVDGHAVRVGRFAFVTAGADGFVPTGVGVGDGSSVSGGSSDSGRALFGALAADEMATYVALDGRLAARIVLKDVPRANAKASLARLRQLGVRKLSMLTGDKAASANIIAAEVGIDDVRAELFPEDKLNAVKGATQETPERQPWWDRLVQHLTGESITRPVTMMVGDGVNDAPVLASADIGMAITDGTSTAASESAQVVIMNDDIAAVPKAIGISRRTKRVMLQAVVGGLGLSIIAMVLAAFNLIPVVIGAFLQEAIDVVSILWALTALFDRE